LAPLSRAALARLPKAELHLHFEGAVLPGDLRALYPRTRRPPLPRSRWRTLYSFHGFGGFLKAFGGLCALLETPDDFGRLVPRLAVRLRRQGVRRAELLLSLPVHTRRGLSAESVLESILARREAARAAGVEIGLILDGVRQWGAEALAPCVDLGRRYRDQGVLGIGLGGDETSRPPEEFRPLFERARDQGLRTVLHSGETGSAAALARDLRVLRPERVGHALRAAEQPRLLDALAEAGTPVEVAVTSNWRTGLIPRRADHPLPEFLRRGVRVVLATDDPAFFGCDLLGEYERAQRLCRLSASRVRALALGSLEAAFTAPGAGRPWLPIPAPSGGARDGECAAGGPPAPRLRPSGAVRGFPGRGPRRTP
jgi:adenosine deaminase